MLNEYRDKTIKAYLSKIGSLNHKSPMYGTLYYNVVYENKVKILIRFADHYNPAQSAHIDIVKTSVGFYTIKTLLGISATLTTDTVLPYLKSLLLVYPEIVSTFNNLTKAASKAASLVKAANNTTKKLQDNFNKKSEEFELADQVWEENKELKKQVKELEKSVENLKKDKAKLQSQRDGLVNKLAKIQSFKDKVSSFIQTLNSL